MTVCAIRGFQALQFFVAKENREKPCIPISAIKKQYLFYQEKSFYFIFPSPRRKCVAINNGYNELHGQSLQFSSLL